MNPIGRRGNNRPLDGIRVLDFGQIIAMPYCGALLADLGAEVIRIEAPMRADPRRADGVIAGTFQVLHRGKRSLILDLTKPEGIEIVKKLVTISDIVLENFSGRVMRNFGLHYEELEKINPRIVMCSNTGYGSTGPWAPLPIQATALEGTLGFIQYTGYPDLPSKVGGSYADFLSAWTGLTFVLAALNNARRTGHGQWIDQSMYQVGVMTIPEPILKIQLDGVDYDRIGNHDRWKAPSNTYRAKGDDEWMAISVDSDEKWQRLAEIMGRPELGKSEMFATFPDRKRNEVNLDAVVSEWTATQDRFEAMKLLQANGIAASAVQHAAEMLFDEHTLEHGLYEPVDYGDEAGIRPLIGRPYRTTNSPLHIKGPAPEFADSNRYVLAEVLHYSEEEIEQLYAAGAVSDVPTGGRRNMPATPSSPPQGIAQTSVTVASMPAWAGMDASRHDPEFEEKIKKFYGDRQAPSATTTDEVPTG